jgi:hypothetical protein
MKMDPDPLASAETITLNVRFPAGGDTNRIFGHYEGENATFRAIHHLRFRASALTVRTRHLISVTP